MKIAIVVGAVAWCVAGAVGIRAASIQDSASKTATNAQERKRATWFESDPRLEGRVTAVARTDRHGRLWGVLSGRTGVRIECEAAALEFRDAQLSVGATSVSSRSLMDALASMGDARWEYTERKTYRLKVSSHELEYVFIPREERERERFLAGKPFLQALDAMPADRKAALESGRSVPFTSIPPEMQSSVGAMLGSLSQEYREKGLGDTIQVGALPGAAFRLDRKSADGFNELFLTVRVAGVGSSGWRLNDFEEQQNARAEKSRARKSDELEEVYASKAHDFPQLEAKRLPALQRKVDIDLKDSTFPQVLRDLHDRYGIPFVSDVEQYMRQRADVRITRTPLGDALDKLTDLYKDTEWEWRKMGFLIVRGPDSSVRKRLLKRPSEEKQPASPAKTSQSYLHNNRVCRG